MPKQTEKNKTRLTIVKAEKSHSKFLWECRNEESSRNMFENTEYVRWEEHEQWMTRSLLNENRYLYIGIIEKDIPFGLVRFDKEEDEKTKYIVSINLAKEWRQMGLAKPLLIQATNQASTELKKTIVIIARIKKQNTASIELFKSTKYKEVKQYDSEYRRYEKKIIYDQEERS